MIQHSIRSLLILTLAVGALTGCKKNPYGVTPLRGPGGAVPGDSRSDAMNVGAGGGRATADPIPSASDLANADGTIRLPSNLDDLDKNFNQDPAPLKAQTVYFEFDRSTVRSEDYGKLAAVGDYLKSNPRNSLLIEGHCDERGTEEYNRSLGERRALALREYLANSGVNPARVVTKSFGEDRPVELGHDEAAWSKNRRGDFIVLIPK